jgi:hypothetical protein
MLTGSMPLSIHLGRGMMTAREKAIEAAASEIRRIRQTDEGYGWSAGPETLGRAAVNAAAPYIESALLDRIEEAVKEKRDVAQRLREAAGKGSLVDWTEATRMDTLDAVLAILTEIREGAGE